MYPSAWTKNIWANLFLQKIKFVVKKDVHKNKILKVTKRSVRIKMGFSNKKLMVPAALCNFPFLLGSFITRSSTTKKPL